MITLTDVHKRYWTSRGEPHWVLRGISLTFPADRNTGVAGRARVKASAWSRPSPPSVGAGRTSRTRKSQQAQTKRQIRHRAMGLPILPERGAQGKRRADSCYLFISSGLVSGAAGVAGSDEAGRVVGCASPAGVRAQRWASSS